jgi:predicted anti-sigma-YlaC factor YlaD
MSFDNIFISCEQVQPQIVLYIDHELFDQDQVSAVESHFGECLSCRQMKETEERALSMMRDLLNRTLFEPAPQELHDRVRQQTEEISQQMAGAQGGASGSYFYSEVTHTEITTEDGTQIEIRREIHREFPLE